MKQQINNPASLAALLWLDNSILVGSITSRFLEGLPTTEIKRYDLGEFRLALDQTALTAPPDFSFHTRRLFLEREAVYLSDVDLAAYLIEAVQQGASLADGRPLLEGSLESQVAQITRLPNEEVALTEMPRHDLATVMEKTRELFIPAGLSVEKKAVQLEKISAAAIVAETPLRAALRTYLLESNTLPNNLVTVFVIATENGFATGLWNSGWGLFAESSESLPPEFAFDDEMSNEFEEFPDFELHQPKADQTGTEPEITKGFYETEPLEKNPANESSADAFRRSSLAGFLHHALNTALRLGGETVHELGFGGVERVVFAVSGNCLGIAGAVATEKSEMENTEILLLQETVEEQVLRGLLYSQIPDNPLAVANLSRDLHVRLIDNSIAAEQAKIARQVSARRSAVQAIALPIFLLLGFILGSVLYQQAAAWRLEARRQAAISETARLQPILKARESYIENFKWRESFLNQTLALKDRQTIAISFLPAVDSKYALAQSDPKFSLDAIKLDNGGAWTMKGIASTEELIASFVRGLEYAENEGNSQKVFSNLTVEINRGGGGSLKASSGSSAFKSSLANVPNGFIGWEIKGVYTPLAKIAPPSVKPMPLPAASPTPGATPSPPPNQPPPAQKNQ